MIFLFSSFKINRYELFKLIKLLLESVNHNKCLICKNTESKFISVRFSSLAYREQLIHSLYVQYRNAKKLIGNFPNRILYITYRIWRILFFS